MNSEASKSEYKQAIASYLGSGPENISLFWKGRIAFYGILKALGIGPGDEVIIPAFTCVVVPNAILYLGAVPVYVDIDPVTFNINPALVEEKISSRTKVILAQNTFGLSADMDALLEIGNRRGVHVVEDCTHGIGGMYKGRKNGTLAKASFFSTQWNKPFSTGLGGFASVEKSLIGSMQAFEASCFQPSWKDVELLRALIAVRNRISGSSLYWQAIHLYRALSKWKFFTGSSSADELIGTQMPDDYLEGISSLQCKAGTEGLKHLDENVKHQREIAARYTKFLNAFSVRLPEEPEGYYHSYLKYPLLVSDRKLFLQLAEKNQVEMGDWFLSPIHPVTENLECWKYIPGSCKIAERVSSQIVNLPTNRSTGEKQLKAIFDFLEKHHHLLVKNKS